MILNDAIKIATMAKSPMPFKAHLVGICIRQWPCDANHPDAVFQPARKTCIIHKDDSIEEFEHKEHYILWESFFTWDSFPYQKEKQEIIDKTLKGRFGYFGICTPELIKDVNYFHNGLPNLKFKNHPGKFCGEIKVLHKFSEDDTLLVEYKVYAQH